MDKINALIDSLSTVRDRIVSLVQFLIASGASILNSIWNAFIVIFDLQIFNVINEVVDYLWLYIWSNWAKMLMWLISLVFLLLLVSFVIRFFKWEISYKLTLWKRDKLFKD